MKTLTQTLIVICSALFAGVLNAEVTVVIHNKIGEKELWLYMDCQPNPTVSMPNRKYIQPWLNGKPVSEPYTLTFTNINSGNLSFGVMGKNSEKFLKPPAAVPPDSDAYYGFIEFTYLATDPHVTWDLTNVVQTGLMCGMTCPDKEFKQCGYKQTGTEFLAGLLKACNLTTSSSVYKKCGPGGKYRKLVSPDINPGAYNNVMADYLTALEKNKVTVKLYSDDLANYSVNDKEGHKHEIGGPASALFEGTFQDAATVDMVDNVILKLTGSDVDKTDIYLTTKGLNGTSAFKGDSDGGVYVYQGGQEVGKNVHLNWVTLPAEIPTTIPRGLVKKLDTQAMVSSVIRNLVTAMNTGEIAYKMNAVYDQKDKKTWVPAYSGKYANMYNQYIVNNSNSYGMPYSDAAHSKVQYFSSGNSTVQLYLLGPDDPATSTYYNPDSR